MPLFNFGGKHKELYCNKCCRTTEHVSVSRSEAHLISNHKSEGFWDWIADTHPVINIVEGVPFRCTKCNSIRSYGAIDGDNPNFHPW